VSTIEHLPICQKWICPKCAKDKTTLEKERNAWGRGNIYSMTDGSFYAEYDD
jgi:hypothetical protein